MNCNSNWPFAEAHRTNSPDAEASFPKQNTLGKKKLTRRERFLNEMDQLAPRPVQPATNQAAFIARYRMSPS